MFGFIKSLKLKVTTMSEISVKIGIAGRTYPLKINADEELNVRNAEATVNSLIDRLEKNYQITDKQDLFSMCLIQLATELEKLKTEQAISTDTIATEIEKLNDTLDQHLKAIVL